MTDIPATLHPFAGVSAARMLDAAADLVDDPATTNPEYMRGIVELIASTHGIRGDGDAARADVYAALGWPDPSRCTVCGADIAPDDGGAIWYHVESMSAWCDGDDSPDLTRQATPTDTLNDKES